MNKVVSSAAEAVSDIPDGATVLVGGFGQSGMPQHLVDALVDQGARDLTIVCSDSHVFMPFVYSGQARKIVAGLTRHAMRPDFTRLVEGMVREGKLEAEVVPHGILEERIRAGGAGIAGFYSPIGIGTPIDQDKEKRVIDGKEYVLEKAINADYALVKGWQGDRWANIVCRRAAGNRNITMATGAKVTIAEVEEIVDLGALDPNRVDIPGIFVRRIVQAEKVVRWVTKVKEAPEVVAPAIERGLTRELIALRVARELRDGMYVNLGFGLPTLASSFLPEGQDIILHSENGILGYGPILLDEAERDIEQINAGGQPVTMLLGGSFFDLATSFVMVRGGHLDVSVLGAFQVSEAGDLANWQRGRQTVGGIGGAMELAVGAKRVIVAMEHTTQSGEPKIVKRCSYPLTASGVVKTIITNLAYIDVTPEGLLLKEVAPGVTPDEVQQVTEPRLMIGPELREMNL